MDLSQRRAVFRRVQKVSITQVGLRLWLISWFRRIGLLIETKVEFAQIPKEQWYQPDWIDENRATESRNKMVQNNIIYGGEVTISSTFVVVRC